MQLGATPVLIFLFIIFLIILILVYRDKPTTSTLKIVQPISIDNIELPISSRYVIHLNELPISERYVTHLNELPTEPVNYNVYFQHKNLYLNYENERLKLSPHKQSYILNFFNPKLIEPFYIKAFRNDHHDESFATRRGLNKIAFIIMDNLLLEVKQQDNKIYLVSRVHMCGDYAYLTLNGNNIEFDGKGKRIDFTIQSNSIENIKENLKLINI